MGWDKVRWAPSHTSLCPWVTTTAMGTPPWPCHLRPSWRLVRHSRATATATLEAPWGPCLLQSSTPPVRTSSARRGSMECKLQSKALTTVSNSYPLFLLLNGTSFLFCTCLGGQILCVGLLSGPHLCLLGRMSLLHGSNSWMYVVFTSSSCLHLQIYSGYRISS